MEVLAGNREAVLLYEELRQYHIRMEVAGDEPYPITDELRQIQSEFGSQMSKYLRSYGYGDIYRVCTAHGHVMYTGKKRS